MPNVTYKEIKEVLRMLDVNPYEFWVIAGSKVTGWFPDLPQRKRTDVERIVNIILEGE